MRWISLIGLLCFAAAAGSAAAEATVLVEAEGFADLGGWVLDQQFMDLMGSPFLLAHGLGEPVKDAVTAVRFTESGEYRVWVRTRDWVGPWKTEQTPPAKRAEGAPGIFQVLLNGTALEATFGAEGAQWHWQPGGSVQVAAGELRLALHDLTGFEGRCDAILFSTDPTLTPPNEAAETAAFRQRLLGHPENPVEAGEYDLVVVGGGIAGTCAALGAGRNGVRVALIQDRPVLGGNNSSDVRVWMGGAIHGPKYPHLGDVVAELDQERREHYGPKNTADIYEDGKKADLVRAEKNIALFLNQRANGVEMAEGRIAAVIAQDVVTGERRRFRGKRFADCTGDACIGVLAGADAETTPSGHMGPCNLWNAANAGKPSPFPRCPWALNLSEKPFPGRDPKDASDSEERLAKLGVWYWESGFYHDPIRDREYMRDWNFRAMYGAWDCLKNTDGQYSSYKLNWSAYISGPRESRRLLGDVVLSKEILLSGESFDDGCVVTGWDIDLHLPDPRYEPGFEGDAFISHALYTKYPRPFHVPYRCFYSRNVPNLFMAGRDISVTHEALGAVRVMRTCGLMGETVGLAAALCRKYDCQPRDVYAAHLDEFKQLLTRGVNPGPEAVAK